MIRPTKLALKLTLIFALLRLPLFAQSPASSPFAYGAYPANYQEIVSGWLNTHLEDPKSALVEWLGDPKPGELPSADGKKITGYVVEFSVNSRNRFGSYAGKRRHRALIRDGQVLQVTGFIYRSTP